MSVCYFSPKMTPLRSRVKLYPMKKEVIYFDAGAFGPFAKCELEDEYLVSDVKK